MDSVTHIKNKSVCEFTRGKWKANPLVNGESCGSEDYGMLEGDIMAVTINQLSACPFFPSTGDVGADRSLLMLHELTRS